MTAKADFTPDDWAALVRAPLIAGMAISLADPGGPIELTKESMAAMRSVLTAATGDEPDLVADVRKDFENEAREHHNPVSGFKPKDPQELLDELTRVTGLVAAQATPAETEGFRGLLRTAARDAANAAKENGFLGFGGVDVSEKETEMLAQIDAAIGEPVA